MYKYNLLERLDRLSGNDREIFWDWAPRQLYRNRETIRGWLYIPEKDGREISATNLIKLSVFFQCHVEDLFNTPIDREQIINSINNHAHVHLRNYTDTE